MTLFDVAFLAAQAQPAAPAAPPPSPDVLKALTDLMHAVGGHPVKPEGKGWWTPEGVTAVATIISAVAWPVLAAVLVYKFTPQLSSFLSHMTKVELFGVKAEIQSEVDKSAEEAGARTERSTAPTDQERASAAKVADISKADLTLVRQQVEALATEYETIRASMPPGDSRTRRMEMVVSKMRTIGQAAYDMRWELAHSPSPGRRLQAIASLQLLPDYDLLDWLVDRLREERPFVAYHAAVALNSAAQGENAPHHVAELEAALAKAKEIAAGLRPDTDRRQALAAFEANLAALKAGQPH
jgi:hypothetical protein